MKLFKISLFALLLTVAFSPVAFAQTNVTDSNKTSSVGVTAQVGQLCKLLDELSNQMAAGNIVEINKMKTAFDDLGSDVENIPLTIADKDALKKSLNNIMDAVVKASLAQQGLRYDALDSGTKSQVDAMIATALQAANEAIDKSKTLKEAGDLLKSF